MSNLVNTIYGYLSNRGLRESMSMAEQKKVILTNQISLLMFIILFFLMVAISISAHKIFYVFFLLAFTILLVPFLNHKGFYRLTSFMMSVIFPINALVFSTVFKLELQHHIDITNYFIFRFLVLGGLVIPLVLIDAKHKWILTAAVAVNLLCLLIFDWVCNHLGIGIGQVDIGFENYWSINYFIILPYILILFGFLFLQNINSKYERKVLSLMDDLQIKNSELQNQREEIAAQRDIVLKQKEHIELIHREVTDSINYAKGIQQAVLPDIHEIINGYGGDSRFGTGVDCFVLFRPKDIVSGDFYWATRMNEYLIFTVADCTGHGVPGAFMSMLGITFLNDIVCKKRVMQMSQVLNELRTAIVEALKQTGKAEKQKDGMDIALCSINTITLELQFAGAYNPCWILNPQVREERPAAIQELLPDKMPIAIHENMSPFSEQRVQLGKGDIIYLSSDGYEDQFGGPKNKKFMAKQLKELLVNIHEEPLFEQKKILDDTLKNWIGNGEQIDDVTILGLKI
jgi:serine phosphatase RsbU (regulator of sigma subunit)